MPAHQRRDPSGVMAWQAREWFIGQREKLSVREEEFSARLFSQTTGINVSRLCREEPTVLGIGPVDRMVMFFDPESHPLSHDGDFVVVPQNRKGSLEMAHMMLLTGMPEEFEREAMVVNAPDATMVAALLFDLRALMLGRQLDQAVELRTDIDAMIDEGIQSRLDRLASALDRDQRRSVVIGSIRPRIQITSSSDVVAA